MLSQLQMSDGVTQFPNNIYCYGLNALNLIGCNSCVNEQIEANTVDSPNCPKDSDQYSRF